MKKIISLLCIVLFTQAHAAENLFEDETSFYPRMIRLAHNGAANNTLIASFDVIGAGYIYKSTNDGESWSKISTITENGFANSCCSELYEMPVNMGSVSAGTLFWAVSAHNGIPPANREIKIYKSIDQGQSWGYLSSPVSGSTGLWEAEFIIDDYGRLVMYYASEEHKSDGYNQIIAHKISTDGGLTWGNEIIDVAMNDTIQRPGMPTITQLPNGDYVMVYEICGATYHCDAFYKKSTDGLYWGATAQPGTRIESVSGHHFSHAPTVTWVDNGTINGELVVGAQVLRESANNDVFKQHSVYMVNSTNGDGLWAERAAPLFVPSDGTNPCNSYSPQFLPRLNGDEIIHMTNKECRMYSAIADFNAPVNDGAYRLIAKHSGKALDVSGCSSASGANIQQWSWTGSECQRWSLEYLGSGDYKITLINSGQTLEVSGCSTVNGGNVQQYLWSDANCQKWKIEPTGNNFYRLVNKHSGKVLDVDACSINDGQNVQQWEWLGGDCQQWKLEAVSSNTIDAGEYSIISKNSNKALDVSGCGASAGDNIQQWPWSGADCQRWQLTATTDGFYQIISKNSNLALDIDACLAVDGQNIQQWSVSNADCQEWGIEQVEAGYYKIFSKNGGKVLDVDACSTLDGANVKIWQWIGGDCQLWRFEPL